MEAPTGRGGGGKGGRRGEEAILFEIGKHTCLLGRRKRSRHPAIKTPAYGGLFPDYESPLPPSSPPMAVAPAAQHQKFAATSLPSLVLSPLSICPFTFSSSSECLNSLKQGGSFSPSFAAFVCINHSLLPFPSLAFGSPSVRPSP